LQKNVIEEDTIQKKPKCPKGKTGKACRVAKRKAMKAKKCAAGKAGHHCRVAKKCFWARRHLRKIRKHLRKHHHHHHKKHPKSPLAATTPVKKHHHHHHHHVKTTTTTTPQVTTTPKSDVSNNCANTLAFQVFDTDTENSATETLTTLLNDNGLDYSQVKEIIETHGLSDSQVLETLSKIGASTTLAVEGQEVLSEF